MQLRRNARALELLGNCADRGGRVVWVRVRQCVRPAQRLRHLQRILRRDDQPASGGSERDGGGRHPWSDRGGAHAHVPGYGEPGAARAYATPFEAIDGGWVFTPDTSEVVGGLECNSVYSELGVCPVAIYESGTMRFSAMVNGVKTTWGPFHVDVVQPTLIAIRNTKPSGRSASYGS
jgi:hypothetical protein